MSDFYSSPFADLSCLVNQPDGDADSVIIWLHGLGADGHDFAPVVDIVRQQSQQPGLKGILPHAPQLAVTINMGMKMPAWYDILAASPQRTINQQQFSQAVAAVQQLIEQQIAQGIDSRRIFIAGFSQGGAVAYETALTHQQPLGGLICLSTYLARPLDISVANQALPLFLGHGVLDNVVPPELGQQALAQLQQQGLQPQWHQYRMQHEVCMEEISAIAEFMQQCL